MGIEKKSIKMDRNGEEWIGIEKNKSRKKIRK